MRHIRSMDHLENDLSRGESDSATKGILIVRADALRNFTRLVTSLGGDAMPLLRRARIDPAILENHNAVISYRAMVQLQTSPQRDSLQVDELST